MADLTRKTANLFDDFDIVGQVPSVNNGNLVNSVLGGTTSFIKMDSAEIVLSYNVNVNIYLFLYNNDFQFIGYAQKNTGEPIYSTSITGYSNAVYCRVRVDKLEDFSNANIMLNTGSTALPYEPYGWVHSLRKLGTDTDTITTLPAELYTDGTNATVGLKGNTSQSGTPSPTTPIQPSECGERTGNLFDITAFVQGISPNRCTTSYDGTTNTLTINATGNDAHTGNTNSYHIPVTGGETYTLSWGTNAVSGQMYIFENGLTDSSHLHDWNSSLRQISITMRSDTTFIIVRLGCNAANTVKTYSDIRLNSGSTAISYEPYGYKLDISSGGKNLFDYDSYFDSVFTPYNEYFEYATIQLSPNTTYTLSTSIKETVVTTRETPFIVATTNQIPTTADGGISNISPVTITTENDGILKLYKRLSGRGIIPTKELFDDGAWLMLNEGSTALPYEPYNRTTTPVYLGEVQTTRRIKKLVLDGTENWQEHPNYAYADRFLLQKSGFTYANIAGYSTHFEVNANLEDRYPLMTYNNGEQIVVNYTQKGTTTLTQFKQWLQDEYANGTPVTIYYVLKTAETGIVNEPLCKIGDYADTVSGISIPTITGKDTVDVETALKPSEVELTYTGWHDATVKEKSENLFDYQTMSSGELNKFLNAGGSLTNNSDWSTTDYIPVNGTEFTLKRTATGNSPAICLYDSDKQYITGVSYDGNSVVTISALTGAHYARFSYQTFSGTTENLSQTMLNTGSTALPYEPYWK